MAAVPIDGNVTEAPSNPEPQPMPTQASAPRMSAGPKLVGHASRPIVLDAEPAPVVRPGPKFAAKPAATVHQPDMPAEASAPVRPGPKFAAKPAAAPPQESAPQTQTAASPAPVAPKPGPKLAATAAASATNQTAPRPGPKLAKKAAEPAPIATSQPATQSTIPATVMAVKTVAPQLVPPGAKPRRPDKIYGARIFFTIAAVAGALVGWLGFAQSVPVGFAETSDAVTAIRLVMTPAATGHTVLNEPVSQVAALPTLAPLPTVMALIPLGALNNVGSMDARSAKAGMGRAAPNIGTTPSVAQRAPAPAGSIVRTARRVVTATPTLSTTPVPGAKPLTGSAVPRTSATPQPATGATNQPAAVTKATAIASPIRAKPVAAATPRAP